MQQHALAAHHRMLNCPLLLKALPTWPLLVVCLQHILKRKLQGTQQHIRASKSHL